MPQADVQRLANDKSGRDRTPAPGYETVPLKQRYWYGYHHAHAEYLTKAQHFKPISKQFNKLMMRDLDRSFGAEEHQDVSLIKFCRQHVATWAIEAMFGSSFFQVNPGLLEAFWKFDSSIFELTMGLPRWLTPASHAAQDQYYSMIKKYLDGGSTLVDHDCAVSGDDTTQAGDVVNKLVEWVKECEFDNDVAVGSIAMLTFAYV
jgi:hypothetical protein